MNGHLRWTGVLILGTFLALGMLSAGSAHAFLDPGSLLFVVGILVGGLWACFGPRAVTRAILVSSIRAPDGDTKQLRTAISVMRRAYSLAWGSGILGLLVGMVIMLRNLDDPSKIGPGMAISLLTLLYGAALAELFFGPLEQVLLNRSATASVDPGSADTGPADGRVARRAAGAAVAMLVVVLFLLLHVSLVATGH